VQGKRGAFYSGRGDHMEQIETGVAHIKVIGVGGAGSNMTNWLHKKGIKGAEILAINTDQQHLQLTSADHRLLIGKEVSKGLGAGGYPETGGDAARESLNDLKEMLGHTDMLFICAGMGGGTGTGAAPVVAKMAKEQDTIIIGTVTMPFKIERARIEKAEQGLMELRQHCDTVIVVDNNRLVEIAGNLPVKQAFSVANELVSTMIRGIVETIAVPSLVNLDFADVKAIMTNGGVASIGVGNSDTNQKVEESVKGALSNPLLDVDYRGATGALIHIEGGPDLTLDDIAKAGDLVTATLDDDANVIWGARINDNMEGKIIVMTIITGVKSPWILGKEAKQTNESEWMNNELNIESV
tara:strand:- start:189 stop:1250 length:1062 start_codon:yes stop_codon:yes gene_type:complete